MRSFGWAAALLLVSTASFAQDKSRPDQSQRGSAPTPATRGSTAETSQRGSMGASAGDGERTATPGAGIESGEANGLAGGRTDEGPRGGTGIREEQRGPQDRARDRENDQARGPNQPGSLLRPADSPPDMNRFPQAMGSGAPDLPVEQQPRARGKNYGRARSRHPRAGGIASGRGNPSGATTEGSAGKARRTQPPRHDSEAGK